MMNMDRRKTRPRNLPGRPAVWTLAAALLFTAPPARAEPETSPPDPTPATDLSEQELQTLRETYLTLPSREREAMLAVYHDMGLNLENLLPPPADASGPDESQRRSSGLLKAVRKMKFVRKPADVLAARARIGLSPESLPEEDAGAAELAQWLSRHVMAGEWASFRAFLVERAGEAAEGIYAHVLQSTNQAGSELLPEDVLGLSEAAPAELTEWQIDALAKLLKNASQKSSTTPLLKRFKAGTTWFGTRSPEHRQRTIRLLLSAGLAVEAYEYMPSLEEARADADAAVLFGHAQYWLARASETSGPESDHLVRQAWDLLGELALMEDVDIPPRLESLRKAVDLLPRIPPGPGSAWLRSLFEQESLAAAGLEAVAMKALTIQQANVSEAVQAQAVLTMKQAVDTLLEQEAVQIEQLRVPLRMLTISLLSGAENAVKNHGNKPGVAPASTMLMRAMPNEAWRAIIEPSLAARAYSAFIGVALISDETDLAIDLLAQAVERLPDQGEELASDLLTLWVQRLHTRQVQPRPQRFYAGGRRSPSAPVTRGWQRRNLARLTRLLAVLEEIGVDGRSLGSIVPAFAACHGRTETYLRENVLEVLGPMAEIEPAVAAGMAESMRSGLNGDWRDRKAQRDAGFQRSESELRAIVERGYQLALELIDSALAQGGENAWRYSTIKASLAYDLMQLHGEREQDAAAHHAARKELFRAFQEAAGQYRTALDRGDIRATPQLYLTWFSVSLGSSDLGALNLDDLLSEGMENTDQIDLIRADILTMAPDNAQLHFGEFARGIVGALPQLQPAVKPRLVRAAARIVSDHPAGASLRRTLDLYDDLVRDEIKLKLAIDGSDRVGTQPFGAVLTMLYTASIDRDSGGFSRYLQNQVYTFVGGRYQAINYRDRLQTTIRESFGDAVEILSIGFFESMNPGAPIEMEGQPGWEEKPIAYLVLQASDPSVDHLPEVQMDLSFQDSTGPVVLPIRSNTVLIDAAAQSQCRPILNLNIELLLDPRPMLNRQDPPVVNLEVTARGEGVLPPLHMLLDELDTALPGYELAEAGIAFEQIQADLSFLSNDEPEPAVSGGIQPDPAKPYVEPDEQGLFRMGTMKSWTLSYTPLDHGAAERFTFPRPAAGLTAVVTRHQYEDMDYVAVPNAVVTFSEDNRLGLWIGTGLVLLVGMGGWMMVRRRRGHPSTNAADPFRIPAHATPLSAVVTLDRLEQTYGAVLAPAVLADLQRQRAALQQAYFSADAGGDAEVADLDSLVRGWVNRCRSA